MSEEIKFLDKNGLKKLWNKINAKKGTELATLDSNGDVEQIAIKARQDANGNVIDLTYQTKTLSVPVASYNTVEECLTGLKQEIEVLIGGTITQEDLDTLKEISEAVFKARNDIEELKESVNDIVLGNVSKASKNTYGVVKVGDNIDVEDGVISVNFKPVNDYTDEKFEEAKEYTNNAIKNDQNVTTVDVDCDHQYEITGQTGHEYNLAIPDETTVKVKKIAGQTRRRSLNLFDYNFNATSNGITFTSNNDGSITLNGTATSKAVVYNGSKELQGTFCFSLNGLGKTKYEINAVGIFSDNNTKNFTYQNTATFGFTIIVVEGTTLENYKIYPMLVEGAYTADTIPAFQPYDNTLVNSYVSKVISTNENLSDVGSLNRTNTFLSNKLLLKGVTYTISFTSPTSQKFNLNLVDKNNTKLYTIHSEWGVTKYQKTFTPTMDGYLSINGFESTYAYNDIMLNYGSEAKPYVPHQADSSFTLGYELGAYDYIDNETNQLVKQTSQFITLNGTETIEKYNTIEGVHRFRILSKPITNNATLISNQTNTISNWIDATPDNIWLGKATGIALDQDGDKAYIVIGNMAYSDVDSFKQWLSENPITFTYKLAEPVITDLITPDGYKVWNSGLQIQEVVDGYLPYVITKEYAISVPAQVKNNADIARAQQEQINQNAGDIQQNKNEIENVKNSYVPAKISPDTIWDQIIDNDENGIKIQRTKDEKDYYIHIDNAGNILIKAETYNHGENDDTYSTQVKVTDTKVEVSTTNGQNTVGLSLNSSTGKVNVVGDIYCDNGKVYSKEVYVTDFDSSVTNVASKDKLEFVMSNIQFTGTKAVSVTTGGIADSTGYFGRGTTYILKGLTTNPTISGSGSTITYNAETGLCSYKLYGNASSTAFATITYNYTMVDLWNNRDNLSILKEE